MILPLLCAQLVLALVCAPSVLVLGAVEVAANFGYDPRAWLPRPPITPLPWCGQ